MPPAEGDPDPAAGSERAAGELLTHAVAMLRRSGSETPRLDAEVLLGHAFGRDRAWVVSHPEAILPADARAELDRWLIRRAAGEPVAYIRGFKEWLSLRIRTDPRALIPRPETELLAELAIEEVAARLGDRAQRPLVVWDVATGSGALALALALRFRSALMLSAVRLVASDLSPDALELATENLAAHGAEAQVTVALADLLEPAGGSLPRPDVVVANLPYVPSSEVDRLPVAASFEPRAALDGGPDGLDVVRGLLAQLPDRLASGGVALLEVGAGQAPVVVEGAASGGWVSEGIPDLAGIERVVRLHRA